MINLLLIGSAEDRVWLNGLEGMLTRTGYTVSTFYPNLGRDVTLPARSVQIIQQADYFVYLISTHTEGAAWLKMLTPDVVAPLCADRLHIILLVCSECGLPPELAYLPSLYFLDNDIVPSLWESFASSLALVHEMQPFEQQILRYGARDLETFLETAQSLAVAYTGVEAAWEGLQEFENTAAAAVFDRLTADVKFGVNYLARVRLENRIKDISDYHGIVQHVLDDYQVLERDWLNISAHFVATSAVRTQVAAARLRTAAFINFLYLILTLRLLSYCERYMHTHGLIQKGESISTDRGADSQDRLGFLLAGAERPPRTTI